MKLVKKIIVLVTPLLLFVVLVVPYSWVNQQFIVEWLGCGCPVIDEFGNMVKTNLMPMTLLPCFGYSFLFV